ncbi:MAG TPA: acyl-CoA dehydrogenase family protein [Vicinamibacterales bacterium]
MEVSTSQDFAAIGARIEAAMPVLGRHAARVDRENTFPTESVEAVRESGLMAFFVPREHGGLDGCMVDFAATAAALGEECPSTAMIWAMHCQQVAVLAATPSAVRAAVLRRIAAAGTLVGSVTTEPGSADLLRVTSSLVARGDGDLRVTRSAPVVSYGAEAGFFLITMRHPDRPEPVLVLIERGDGRLETVGGWDALGMRGTQSVAMRFDVTVPSTRVIGESFRDVAARTMIPVGHLGWAALWLGAARGLYRRTVRRLRELGAQHQRNLASESLRAKMAEIRLQLDLLAALVSTVAIRVDCLRSRDASIERYREPAFIIQVNNLKVSASRISFAVADALMEVCGLFDGYLRASDLGTERVFRDLRSASLMYSNERLLQASGNLLFIGSTSLLNTSTDSETPAGVRTR